MQVCSLRPGTCCFRKVSALPSAGSFCTVPSPPTCELQYRVLSVSKKRLLMLKVRFEWWQKRRGLAIGIMYSGTGIGGLTVPFIASGLLQAYGRRVTLLSLVRYREGLRVSALTERHLQAIGYAVLLAATIPFIRPRIPITRNRHGAREETPPIRWNFLATRAFWTLFLGVLLQGLGGFVPPTSLPCKRESL